MVETGRKKKRGGRKTTNAVATGSRIVAEDKQLAGVFALESRVE